MCVCVSLSTFTHNMLEFGLSKKLCQDFLKKQAIIGNLNEGTIHNMTVEPIPERLLCGNEFHSWQPKQGEDVCV